MSELMYVPSTDEVGYVQLSRTKIGKLFRKKILPMNKHFIHPADHKTKIFITPELAASLVSNFNNNLVEHVQTTVVNKDNQHSEDPRDNVGEVVGLEYDDTGVYATIDARKHADEFGKTFLDSSAFMHMNYTDTETGNKVGPTLLHVAVTNRGHVRNMGDYEEVAASYADISDEKILFMQEEATAAPETPAVEASAVAEVEEVVEQPKPEETNTLKETVLMTKEELLAALKAEHGIDVEALQTEASRTAELSAQLTDVNEQLALSGEKAIQVTDLAEAVVELSNSNKSLATKVETLSEKNAALELSAAESEVDKLVSAGKVLPAQRDVMVKLSMNDRETFDALVPANPIVSLSEGGVTVHEASALASEKAEMVAGYVARANALKAPKK